MYIWKTSSLAADIKNGVVGGREWKNYYLAVSIFITLSMYLAALAPREHLVAVLVEAIAVVGILIFGVSITYQTNKGDRGVDYISRMTALSFPILVKLLVVGLLFGVLIGIVGEVASFSEFVMEWFMVAFSVAIQVIFFWRINVHLKCINA